MNNWIRQPTLEDIRDYRHSTRKMLDDGEDLFRVIGAVDSRLADIANHVAICHRCVAEYRAQLAWCWFSGRKELADKIQRAGDVLEEVLDIQQELIDVRLSALGQLAARVNRMDRFISELYEKTDSRA